LVLRGLRSWWALYPRSARRPALDCRSRRRAPARDRRSRRPRCTLPASSLRNGDGSLRTPVSIAVGKHPLGQGGPHVAAADLDADGLPELIEAGYDTAGSSLVSNAVVLRTCGRGTSLDLTGAAGFASAAHSPQLNPQGDWTVELWFKDDSVLGFNHDYTVLLNKGDRTSSPDAPYFVSVGFKRIVVGKRAAWTDHSVPRRSAVARVS
jgi:hypothetical protein